MSWYYNTSSGDLTKQTGTLADITGWINTFAAPVTGWHKLNVPDSATAAQAAADAVKEFPHAAPPTTSAGQATVQQVGSETGLPVGAVTGLTQAVGKIGAFFESLTHGNTWRSLGWLMIGVILFLVSLVMLLRHYGIIPETQPVPVPIPV